MYNPQTTDNQEEVYDVVNENDEVIGTATRRQVHADPTLIHRATGLFVFNSDKQLLMQKRSKTKDMFPQYWVFSVGGHVDSGDTYEKAIVREMKEELGIEVEFFRWKKELQPVEHETEFWMMYYTIHNGPFPNFNRVEADEVRFFEIDQLIAGGKNQTLLMPPNVIRLLPEVREFINSTEFREKLEKLN